MRKQVLFLTNSGLTKSYKGLIYIAEKVWAPCCTVDERGELQNCQNDALRICTKVKLNDRVRIEYLHEKCKIVKLEQRRRQQLLMLMYKKSKDYTMHKVFPMNTRRSNRIVFKTDTYEGTLYKCSPYFVGSKLWDKLPMDVIEAPDIFVFKKMLLIFCHNGFNCYFCLPRLTYYFFYVILLYF